jgi:hypothetical protein
MRYGWGVGARCASSGHLNKRARMCSVCMCLRACVRARARMCVCVCVCTCVTCAHTFTFSNAHSCTFARPVALRSRTRLAPGGVYCARTNRSSCRTDGVALSDRGPDVCGRRRIVGAWCQLYAAPSMLATTSRALLRTTAAHFALENTRAHSHTPTLPLKLPLKTHTPHPYSHATRQRVHSR